MSASMMWQPTGKGRDLGIGAPSSFMETLERGFGCKSPWILGEDSLPVLRGMAAADTYARNDFSRLIEIIEKHGEIRVWPEY